MVDKHAIFERSSFSGEYSMRSYKSGVMVTGHAVIHFLMTFVLPTLVGVLIMALSIGLSFGIEESLIIFGLFALPVWMGMPHYMEGVFLGRYRQYDSNSRYFKPVF